MLLVAIGLLNLIPVIGAISAEQLASLYGIGIESADLEVLMRHRAIMLGLIGAFLLAAAFRPSLQVAAASMGLVSMLSFVILTYVSGENGAKIEKVFAADIVGSFAAAVVLVIVFLERPSDS